MNKEQELKERISENRIIKKKDGSYICKFCKNHPDDCFCNDNAKLELKGYQEAQEEFNKKLKQLKKKPQKVSSFSQDKPDYNKIIELINRRFNFLYLRTAGLDTDDVIKEVNRDKKILIKEIRGFWFRR